MLAVIALFYGVGYWNAFFDAMLYLNDRHVAASSWCCASTCCRAARSPARAIRASRRRPADGPDGGRGVATVPILIVYPFLQRYFTKGVLTGAIKG